MRSHVMYITCIARWTDFTCISSPGLPAQGVPWDINFPSGARGKGVILGTDSCILKWSFRDGLSFDSTISLVCSYSGHSNRRTQSHAGGHASVSDYGMGVTSDSLSRA